MDLVGGAYRVSDWRMLTVGKSGVGGVTMGDLTKRYARGEQEHAPGHRYSPTPEHREQEVTGSDVDRRVVLEPMYGSNLR